MSLGLGVMFFFLLYDKHPHKPLNYKSIERLYNLEQRIIAWFVHSSFDLTYHLTDYLLYLNQWFKLVLGAVILSGYGNRGNGLEN